MENAEETFPQAERSEACLPAQPTAARKRAGSNSQEIKHADPLPITRALGISEKGLRALRAEAQHTFECGAVADMAFYKASRRPIIVRIVAWYGGTINRAAGQYGQRLVEAAAHHRGFGPEQHQAIQEEVQDFAQKKIDQRVARVWFGLFCGNRSEPGFTKMVMKVMAELAECESNLTSEARANINRAADIYAEKPRMRRYSERRLRHVQSKREKEIREISSLGYEGLSYCREVDGRRLWNPEWLRDKDWPGTYEAAYKLRKKWRKRIQQEKWRICHRRND